MNALELLTLNEAKEQVSGGQASQALPKLFKLAAAYPQNGDIQAAIRQALNSNVQATKPLVTKPAVTKPVAKPVTKPAATTAEKTQTQGKAWYGLPFIGTLVTAA